ncbi:uncharacterized protein LOC124896675 [Capsicum annuum]|uniref:uncharacterized protein LOC124896675 n=1 Tax=Capsicum annuum TaxID=4072 RepID=UPI001FB08486|nr:uncharacterized protein LOC124896675 [Capsicum annuum]
MPKAKAKEVIPQSREANDEKEIEKSNEEVEEVKKPQGEARSTIQVPLLFHQHLHKKEKGDKLRKFKAKLSNLSINIPLLEAIQEILGYAKLMKKLISKKKLVEDDTIEVTHRCSAIMNSKVMQNKDDPGVYTIPCTTGMHEFAKALCNLDRSIKRSVGISFDVLIKVDKFILLVDFMVLDYKMDQEVPIILCHPLLATGKAIVDLKIGEIKFRVQEDEVSFKIYKKKKKQTAELQVAFMLDVKSEKVNEKVLDDPLECWR